MFKVRGNFTWFASQRSAETCQIENPKLVRETLVQGKAYWFADSICRFIITFRIGKIEVYVSTNLNGFFGYDNG